MHCGIETLPSEREKGHCEAQVYILHQYLVKSEQSFRVKGTALVLKLLELKEIDIL